MRARATLDSDELIAVRHLDADPEMVWRMFTTPEHLAAFWGGDHATIRTGSVSADLRIGGAFTLATVGVDGCSHPLRFRYEVIDPPSLLSFSSPHSGLVTEISLEPAGVGTMVRIRQRALPADLRTEQARTGLTGVLERLALVLTDLTRTEGMNL
ncbi:SRPBCC domain-containing protein [Microbacterium sp. dk485]|uniref:SRPBCC family protein n=1 Tax=Microbacterium sp. dk485 TaxID=2560021 RepID=UPI0010744FE5|nr:SRPBCC domain-containing protein [Microbacterium sp. dk485]TFV81928.1 SRPBCC domain-containing protein [Microbacterium sp. dk485]